MIVSQAISVTCEEYKGSLGQLALVLLGYCPVPGMRGPELAKQLKRMQADLRVVYMSGYLEFNQGGGEFLEDGFFLQKPFSRDTFVQKVDEALKTELALR